MGNLVPDDTFDGFMTFMKRPVSDIMSSDLNGEITSIYNLQTYCSKGSTVFQVMILCSLEQRAWPAAAEGMRHQMLSPGGYP